MSHKANKMLVLMSDFGTRERFVASMKGVALGVDEDLKLFDLTHDIEPYNIWEAAQTLAGTVPYWPAGTVFVAVVDPGVGTDRRSVVAQTRSGCYIVSPDNGTLTLVAQQDSIVAVREIDERTNRRPGSSGAHTFHGRDVYAYTGARLAAGLITFEEVGPLLSTDLVQLPYENPEVTEAGVIVGTVIKIEHPFGNIVTDIPGTFLERLSLNPELMPRVEVTIDHGGTVAWSDAIPYAKSFGFVGKGEPLLYVDSVGQVGIALNTGDFSGMFGIQAGPAWRVELKLND